MGLSLVWIALAVAQASQERWAALPVQPRAQGIGRPSLPCDLAEELLGLLEGSPPPDPGPAVARLLACDRSGPAPAWRVAESRALAESVRASAAAEADPARAVERALDLYELGQALRYGALADQRLGLDAEGWALGLLEERTPELGPEERPAASARWEALRAAEPALRLDVEAAARWAGAGQGGLHDRLLAWSAERAWAPLLPLLAAGDEAAIAAAAEALHREHAEGWFGHPFAAEAGATLARAARDLASLRARGQALPLP